MVEQAVKSDSTVWSDIGNTTSGVPTLSAIQTINALEEPPDLTSLAFRAATVESTAQAPATSDISADPSVAPSASADQKEPDASQLAHTSDPAAVGASPATATPDASSNSQPSVERSSILAATKVLSAADATTLATPPAGTQTPYLRQVYVDTSSHAARDTNPGTRVAPLKTIMAAVRQIRPGDEIIVRPGVYREAIIVPGRTWGSQPTRLRAETPRTALIKGSVAVSSWREEASGLYSMQWTGAEPSQVYRKGSALKQVAGTIFGGYPLLPTHQYATLHASQGGIWLGRLAGGRNSMPLDSFFFDSSEKRLYVRLSSSLPADEELEVSVARFVLQAMNVTGFTVEGLDFEHSNTSYYWHNGAILINGTGNTLRNLVAQRMDAACVQITGGSDNRLIDSIVRECGQVGVKADGERVLIANNQVYGNNTRNFNKWWEAGGMKFIGNGGLKNSEVSNNQVHSNKGDGIWFDWGNSSNTIQRNLVAYNTGFGIQYEASHTGLIMDNQVFGNGQRGIYLSHSRDTQVLHNLVAFNGLQGIVSIDEGRIDPKGLLDLRPRRNTIAGNLVAWNKEQAVILPGRAYANQSNANLFVVSRDQAQFSMGWPSALSSRDLASWRLMEGQDAASVGMVNPPSPTLASSIASRQLAPDWSELRTTAAAMNLTPSVLQLVSTPALRSRPGPWQ